MSASCVRPHRRLTTATTRRFSIDGRRISIALCDKHNRELVRVLWGVLEPYSGPADSPSAAGRAGARQAKIATAAAQPAAAVPTTAQQNAIIRKWAETNGLEVNRRGPLPTAVREAFLRRPGPVELRRTTKATKRATAASNTPARRAATSLRRRPAVDA